MAFKIEKSLFRKFSKIDFNKDFNEEILSLPHEEFKSLKRKELHEWIQKKKIIYLDLKYWINIRKALFNEKDQKDIYFVIFHKLRELVREGKVVCPISQSIFFELTKQKDSVLKTAQLIDTLSKGICTNITNSIIEVELRNLVSYELTGGTRYVDYVWNKMICVFGEPVFSFNRPDEAGDNNLRNHLFGLSQELGAQEIIASAEFYHDDRTERQQFATILNQVKNNSEKINFNEARRREILSALYSLADLISLEPHFDFSKFKCISDIAALISIIPYLLVFATIHAGMRHTKRRQYKPNDYYDLDHSSIGIGYCDYFFTDNSYAHLLKTKPLYLEKEFNSIVESVPEEALVHLEKL